MSSDDPNLKRMGLFLVLVMYVFSINTCQAIFLNVDSGYDSFMEGGGITEEGQPITDYSGVHFDIWGFTGSFLGFFFGGFLITLSNIGLDPILTIIITIIYIITTLAFWLMLIDFIKDIQILGSSI